MFVRYFSIIYDNFSKIFDELVNNNGVKIKIIGSRDKLPTKIKKIFEKMEKTSLKNNILNLNIAFNYGFKNEIKDLLKKAKKITNKPIVAIGGINPNNYQKLLLNKANFLAISGYIWNNKKLKPIEAIKKLKCN